MNAKSSGHFAKHDVSRATVDGSPSVRSVPLTDVSGLWPERYHMLDGWRGVAALVVVCHHAFSWEIGHEAVMLFFVISGYCITAAASSAIRKRMSFDTFMWRRIRRIYPPYLLSLLWFVLTRFGSGRASAIERLSQYGAVGWLQNFTLTQWISLLKHPQPFAADNPVNTVAVYWSLGYEEQFYLVTAGLIALAVLWRSAAVGLGVVLAVIAIVWNVVSPAVCYGFFLEFWAHFAAGAIVFFRLCRLRTRTMRSIADAALVALLLAGVTRTIWTGDVMHERKLAIEWIVVAGFSLVLIGLRPLDEAFRRIRVWQAFSLVGLISFSLYLIHQCNLHVTSAIAAKLFPFPNFAVVGGVSLVRVVIILALHLGLASLFWYFCERPFVNRTSVPDERAGSRVAVTGANAGRQLGIDSL